MKLIAYNDNIVTKKGLVGTLLMIMSGDFNAQFSKMVGGPQILILHPDSWDLEGDQS